LNSSVVKAYISILLENSYIPEEKHGEALWRGATVTFRKRNMAKHCGEDLRFEQDAAAIQKYKKEKKNLAKLKT